MTSVEELLIQQIARLALSREWRKRARMARGGESAMDG
jgi:hypothetical protein